MPFSPVRGYVLGMIPSRQRPTVTDAELNQMKQILYEAMQAGAFGFSADKNLEDRTEDGSALPSHVASPEEFLALAEVLGEFGVGHLGWTIGISDQRQEHALAYYQGKYLPYGCTESNPDTHLLSAARDGV